MRRLSLTTLMILAAFASGLALGGRWPPSVSAQTGADEILWDNDGESLVLSNQTADGAFLVTGAYKPGASVQPPPWYSNGVLKITRSSDLGELFVYKLRPELACDPIKCRRCDDGGTLCPTPDWPPILHAQDVRSVIDHY